MVDVMTLEFVEVADDVRHAKTFSPCPQDDKHNNGAAILILEMLASGSDQAKVRRPGVAAQGLSDRTMKRAAAELEVVVEGEGESVCWETCLELGSGQPLPLHVAPTTQRTDEHEQVKGVGPKPERVEARPTLGPARPRGRP